MKKTIWGTKAYNSCSTSSAAACLCGLSNIIEAFDTKMLKDIEDVK